MKFYTHQPAFEAERAMHDLPQVRVMMTATIAVEDNAGGAWRAPNGYVFPPFIIMERGESLADFAGFMHRWGADSTAFVTALQVRGRV